jgi:hypothetical protein
MREEIIEIGDGFWNIRGSFRIAGILNIGTQASLVRLQNGSFVFLDSYTLSKSIKRQVEKITGDRPIDAILNLHPFHTVHCEQMHKDFPNAALFGSERHHKVAQGLPWQETLVGDTALQNTFADDFDFSIPRGVDFISQNEKVHFSSVLAYHKASKTIHVDDTLMFIKMPFLLRALGRKSKLSLHPTLSQALEKRPGAASDFRQWAEEIADRWGDASAICAAHTSALLPRGLKGSTAGSQILQALERVADKLEDHEKKYG